MTTLAEARAMDAADPLRAWRDRFVLPEGIIYLDGNSLGPLPRATAPRLAKVVNHEWGERLIRSWNEADWVSAPRRVGSKIARLIGAEEDEVIVADSTSVNLFKLIVAAADVGEGAILAERDNFPTDAYIAERAAGLVGRPFRAVPRAEIEAVLAEGGSAVAVLTHVDYRTAERHDIARLTELARRCGTRIVWDLSHSVGAVPLDLARDGAELAVGCGYKYLNGGPGAPAFLYVVRALQQRLAPPIAGWWSHAAPFDFGSGYQPAPGIDRFSAGTPSMLGLLALEVGVDLMREVAPDLLWTKAANLYDLFAEQVTATCPGLAIASPADAAKRGSHISLAHPSALAIVRALIARGVIGDYRTPNIARFGLTPLYLGYEDVWRATEALSDIMQGEEWRDPRWAEGGVVT